MEKVWFSPSALSLIATCLGKLYAHKYMGRNVRKRTFCAPHGDSYQPVHTLISLRCPYEDTLHPWLFKMRPVKILVSGWSESSLGAHVRRYVLRVFWESSKFVGSCCRPLFECDPFSSWLVKSLKAQSTLLRSFRAGQFT